MASKWEDNQFSGRGANRAGGRILGAGSQGSRGAASNIKRDRGKSNGLSGRLGERLQGRQVGLDHRRAGGALQKEAAQKGTGRNAQERKTLGRLGHDRAHQSEQRRKKDRSRTP